MKILLTCGGTAGHINPAVALARMFQERMEDSQVLFVGAKGGMEERLVPKEGFPLETVTISSFWRSLEPVLPPAQPADPAESIGVQKGGRPDSGRAFSRTWWWGRGDMPPIPWCMRPPAGASPRRCTSPTRCPA